MHRGIRSAVLIAAVAGGAASAYADRASLPFQPEVIGAGRLAERGIVDGVIGFEATEGYVQGPITGQNGWLTNTPRGAMEVRDGVSAGNGSPNALRLSKGPQGQGQLGIAQAPPTPGSNALTVDTRINDDGGANYGILGLLILSPTTSSLSFQVEFDYRGHIFVVEGGAGVDTGVSWSLNQWNPLAISLTPTGLNYFYAGNLIHTSPLQAGGASFDLVQFYHDNFEDISNTANAAGYFDNLRVVPSPGSLALLGLGGLAAARRKRR
jgi:hypothetical protein